MKNPTATVIVPSFNSGHFLNWTLNSIANQTYSEFECIVVDDYSNDDSIDLAKDFFKDSRFTLIRHKMNMGLAGARNTGLRASRGRFVAFLDSDDLMMPDSIEVRVNACLWAAKRSDRYAGSYCGSVQIQEADEECPKSVPQSLPFIDFVSSNGLCPFNANQPMIRRDILRLAGGFNQQLRQAEDFDLWQRILRAGYAFAPAHRCSVTYRRRSGSMIRQAPMTHLNTSLAIINGAERSMAPDQLAWSQYRLPKPISAYIGQKRKISRLLEFSGMGLASQQAVENEEIISLLQSEVPDLFRLTFESDIEKEITKGVSRQIGEVSSDMRFKISQLISDLQEIICQNPIGEKRLGPPGTIFDDQTKDRLWFSNLQSQYDVVFFPHSEYHIWTISLMSKVLHDIGIKFVVVDISPFWRDGGVRAFASKNDINLVGFNEFALGQFSPKCIVVFNDWDPVTRPIVVAAKAAGISTVAIVEGIQDYDDADVHWKRYAYKTADTILLPGSFDSKYFSEHDSTLEVVGVPRIETLRRQGRARCPTRARPRVLINSNFSYGVLIEHRDVWLTQCVEAVIEAGMIPVVSRHPADTGTLFAEYVTARTFYEELEDCEISVQRFASGILEALARGVGVIYHNPHHEKVDKFKQPQGAYVMTSTRDQLSASLQEWRQIRSMAQEHSEQFLDDHAGVLSMSPIQMCCEAIHRSLTHDVGYNKLAAFRRALEVLDLETRGFFQLRDGDRQIFDDPKQAPAKLDAMSKKWSPFISNPQPHIQDSATAELPVAGTITIDSVAKLTAAILLDPHNVWPKFEPGGSLHSAVGEITAWGGPEACHFDRIRGWAQKIIAS